jgi:hypothetical protein
MAFAKKQVAFSIKAPNFQTVEVGIRGTAPLMVHKFSMKARNQIQAKQTSADKVKMARAPKDYKAEFNAARYVAKQGWDGVYAGSFRNSMIRAASYGGGLTMTQAKGLLFVVAEGFDKEDGTPLVRIKGKAIHDTRPARNDGGGIDMRNRPRYDVWSAKLKISYDADLLSAQDVLNLLARAGESVGIGDGRPSSPNSNGCGFGTFNVEGLRQAKHAAKPKTAKRSGARVNGAQPAVLQ